MSMGQYITERSEEHTLEGGEKDFPVQPEKFEEIMSELANMDLEPKEPRYPGLERAGPKDREKSREVVREANIGEKLAEKIDLSEEGLIGEVYFKGPSELSFLLGTDTLNEDGGYENPLNYSVTKNGDILIHSFHWKTEDSPDTNIDYAEKFEEAYDATTLTERKDAVEYMEEW